MWSKAAAAAALLAVLALSGCSQYYKEIPEFTNSHEPSSSFTPRTFEEAHEGTADLYAGANAGIAARVEAIAGRNAKAYQEIQKAKNNPTITPIVGPEAE